MGHEIAGLGIAGLMIALVSLIIAITNPTMIVQQEDIQLTDLADTQILYYNATSQKWYNGYISNGSISLTPTFEKIFISEHEIAFNDSGMYPSVGIFQSTIGLTINDSLMVEDGLVTGSNIVGDASDSYSLGSDIYEWLNLYMGNNGKIYFGTSQDVNLYRGSADLLKTDDGLIVKNNINATNEYLTGYLLHFDSIGTWGQIANNGIYGILLNYNTGTQKTYPFQVCDGLTSPLLNLESTGILQAYGGYKSADGTIGWSGTFNDGTHTITVKNGLITGVS